MDNCSVFVGHTLRSFACPVAILANAVVTSNQLVTTVTLVDGIRAFSVDLAIVRVWRQFTVLASYKIFNTEKGGLALQDVDHCSILYRYTTLSKSDIN